MIDIVEFQTIITFSPFNIRINLFIFSWISLIYKEPFEMSVFMENILRQIVPPLAYHISIRICGQMKYSSIIFPNPHCQCPISQKFVCGRRFYLNSEYIMPICLLSRLFPFKPSTYCIFLWELHFNCIGNASSIRLSDNFTVQQSICWQSGLFI